MCSAAQAASLQLNFGGTISYVEGSETPPPFSVGDPFSGTLTFESQAAPTAAWSNWFAAYSLSSFQLSTTGLDFSASSGQATVRSFPDGTSSDRIYFSSNDSSGGFGLDLFGAPPGSLGLPLPDMLTLAMFSEGRIAGGLYENDELYRSFFEGNVDRLSITPVSAVPLPAAFWLFGSGLLGLLGFGQRRRANAFVVQERAAP